ncbi:MAG: 50S ribosomal protein L17 [Haliscomenobacter sp.]
MRHGNKVNALGRKAAHRHALLRNLAIALIEHKSITTTLAKARELRKYIEPLITKSKNDTTHNRRVVFSYLQNKEAIKELFGTVRDKVGERPGGYARVIKLGFRKGDAAEIAMIELVDFNAVYQAGDSSSKSAASKRRGRRGGKAKAAAETSAATTPVDTATESKKASDEDASDSDSGDSSDSND